jgi:hypothetical protein
MQGEFVPEPKCKFSRRSVSLGNGQAGYHYSLGESAHRLENIAH